MGAARPHNGLSLGTILREWGRLGCIGFGGPPAHIALLRELCVERRRWLDGEEFEDAIAATNLLPGPGSTQLAVYCAWRLGGGAGAIVGGLAFIVPGLVLILALAALFLASAPPAWVLGAGAAAGAAVPAVALRAGVDLAPGSLQRMAGSARARWVAYAAAGALATVLVGPWLVLVLLACGVVELALKRPHDSRPIALFSFSPPLVPLAAVIAGSTLLSLGWTAFKVGALSYGGGFVIIPLMQADAVDAYGWMSDVQFLNAVALGQITPGPVVHTVAVVGYAAAGLGGGLFAAAVAFAPSFAFILIGAERFDRLRAHPRIRDFLNGAGPAAIGAILGVAVPLTLALAEAWQLAVLAAAVAALFVLRRGVVATLVGAGLIGAALALLGAPLPR
jgi:chromate transporter